VWRGWQSGEKGGIRRHAKVRRRHPAHASHTPPEPGLWPSHSLLGNISLSSLLPRIIWINPNEEVSELPICILAAEQEALQLFFRTFCTAQTAFLRFISLADRVFNLYPTKIDQLIESNSFYWLITNKKRAKRWFLDFCIIIITFYNVV